MEDVIRESSEAFAPGASLWVVTDLERSSWAQKIDWYLNFQLLRAQTHRPALPGDELRSVINQWDVEAADVICAEQAPLMVPSARLLPNHAVVLVSFADIQPKDWVKKVHATWAQLDSPSLRVFLPIGLNPTQFAAAWPGEDSTLERALVVDA